MKISYKSVLLASVFCLPVSVPIVHAQSEDVVGVDSSETESTRRFDVVTVSANKRDEGLQDVPLSVTVFSQEKLDLLGATNLGGIQESTPNLNFSVQSAGQNVARVTLRGIGTETLVGGGDPGVALHIDGIYVGRNSVAAADVFDVARVEVLRGPQGTLYGRNATGGSVNIITQKPQDELGGSADLTYGNYNQLRARGVLNVPLSDNIYSRFTFFSDSHDGYIENLYPSGRDGAQKDTQGGRAQVLWDLGAGNEVLLRGYYTKIGGAGPGSRFLGTDISTANGYPSGYLIGASGGPLPPPGAPIVADAYGLGITTTGQPIQPRPTGFHEFRKDAAEFVDQTMKGADLEVNYNLSDSILLRSISSYQTNDNEILVDADNSELPLETRQRENSASQYSQEFNLVSKADSAFQWLAGLYFYNEELTETFEAVTPSGLIPVSTPLPPGAVPGGGGIAQKRIAMHELTSYAVFGQASYDLTDKLTVTAGARHTWDQKDQFRPTGGFVDLTNGFRFQGGGALGPLPSDSGSVEFNEWSYRLSADYALTESNLVYASFSHGYKTGGFDYNGGELSVDGLVPYLPEFVDAIEIGSKNEFFNGAAVFNIAAFNYDYSDLQVFRLTANGPLTDNAAASTIKGLEVEMQVAPTDNLRLDAAIGYLDASYDEYTIDIPPTDFSGNRLNYAPEWTTHVGAEYTIPVGQNNLIARLDWSWRDDTYFDRANTALDTQEAYSLWNARIRYDMGDWFLDFFGRNIGDEKYVTGQLINPPFACGCRTVNVGDPMTFGVTFGARF
jgi:iron complex outermembrane recepter protein